MADSINSNTIPSMFSLSLADNKNSIAFNYYEDSWETMTYSELHSLIECFECTLYLSGIKKGDRVAVVSENRPEWCASYMATVRLGAIAVPIDAQLGAEEVKNLLIDSEAKVVFFSAKTENVALAAAKAMNTKAVPIEKESLMPVPEGFNPSPCDSLSADCIASIIYTSGTTGKPKGVVLTHKNFSSDADAVIAAGVLTKDDTVLSVLPLHHTYPFMCTFIVPLFLGSSITFSPGIKSAEIVSAIKNTGVTVVVCVPRLLDMIRNGIVARIKERKGFSILLLKLMNFCGILRNNSGLNLGKIFFRSVHSNFGKLRFFASGGARLEPEVMSDLEALGFTVLEGYGLTETSPVITFNPPEKRKPGSAGKPLANADIKISDDGEITVKGPMVMTGYYKNQAATEAVLKEGRFFTGDIGHLDDEEYLFITARKKEVIVLSSGKNIYPEDIEKMYSSIALIKEICVVGIENKGVAHAVQAVIVPDLEYAKKIKIGNISETLKWDISAVSMKLPEYMRIKGFTLCQEPLPRTPLGKLRRFMVGESLKASVEAKKRRGIDKELIEDSVGREVVRCINSLADDEASIQWDTNIELDLGFDSLKRVEFVSILEETFLINIPEAFTSRVQTVKDAVVLIKECLTDQKSDTGEKQFSEKSEWGTILAKSPSTEDLKRIESRLSIIETAIVRFLFFAKKFIFKTVFCLKVRGLENIPAEGAFVIAPNHTSYLDAFIIAASVPFDVFKKLYFLGLQNFFAGKLRSWLAKLGHVIPIDQETYLHRALQLSAFAVKKQSSLCIFPEGGRSFDGKLMPFKKGIGVLAVELGVPVIPAYIEGAFKALPKGSAFIQPCKITVSFGSPLEIDRMDIRRKAGETDVYQHFADELRKRVKNLAEG
ncbi:MAG: AMP-binding protein [Nitrospirae bacterium]|nr:AMP-binding protein [Nitrospirota bacterium]